MEKNSKIVVFNAMFKNKKNWINISDEDKSQYFFIFNRYLSKKYVNDLFEGGSSERSDNILINNFT